MAWTVRKHSKSAIDQAGRCLIELPVGDPAREDAIDIVNNWRSCHGYPLQVIKMTLLHRAVTVELNTLIAQRLKRLSSIVVKLRDNSGMRLTQVQDIGGCRAVLKTVKQAYQLVDIYNKSHTTNPKDRPLLESTIDYIKTPKPDGYRSIHLIFRYQSKYARQQAFNNQRIEIQIRSQLQHAWALLLRQRRRLRGKP